MTTDDEELQWDEYRMEKYTWDAIIEGADTDLVGTWRLRRVSDEKAT